VTNLVPFDEYVESDRAHWAGVRLRIGLMFGMGMALFSYFMNNAGIFLAVMLGIFSGTLFGLLWTASMRVSMKRLLRKIYDGDPKIVGLDPVSANYPLRMPCSLLQSPMMAVGGVLHFSEADWRFVPHQRNLPRHRDPVSLAPVNQIQLSVVPGQLSPVSRLFFAKAPPLLELRWNGHSAKLVVPNPESTMHRLRRVQTGAA
jgi:hypothetical protein